MGWQVYPKNRLSRWTCGFCSFEELQPNPCRTQWKGWGCWSLHLQWLPCRGEQCPHNLGWLPLNKQFPGNFLLLSSSVAWWSRQNIECFKLRNSYCSVPLLYVFQVHFQSKHLQHQMFNVVEGKVGKVIPALGSKVLNRDGTITLNEDIVVEFLQQSESSNIVPVSRGFDPNGYRLLQFLLFTRF